MLEPEGGTVVAEKREAPHGSVDKGVSADRQGWARDLRLHLAQTIGGGPRIGWEPFLQSSGSPSIAAVGRRRRDGGERNRRPGYGTAGK